MAEPDAEDLMVLAGHLVLTEAGYQPGDAVPAGLRDALDGLKQAVQHWCADKIRERAGDHPQNAAWVQDCQHLADWLDPHEPPATAAVTSRSGPC